MDEISTEQRRKRRHPRSRGAWARGFSARTVALAVQGLLTFAHCSGPAAAEPAATGAAPSPLTQESVRALKREYLRCDRVSSQSRLTLELAIHCSAVSDELLKREFDGDLDLLLAWWRAARQAAVSD